MNNFELSIVTITFNNYDDLVKTLASTDGMPNTERIVVNGGNCKRTLELLETKKDIVSISEKDNGISDAFNKGINLSTGKNIWILNSGDTLIDFSYPKSAIAHLESSDFVYSNIALEANGNIQTIFPSTKKSLAWGMPFPHPSFIARRSIYEQLGFYDESLRIAMDLDLICRIYKKGTLTGKYIPVVSVLMDGNGISNSRPLQGALEVFKVIRRNGLLSIFEIFSFAKLLIFLTLKKLKMT